MTSCAIRKGGEQVKDHAPLPNDELSQAEWEELREIEAEMKRGECTTLTRAALMNAG